LNNESMRDRDQRILCAPTGNIDHATGDTGIGGG